MKKYLLALFLLLPLVVPAKADSLVVQTCGTLPLAYAPGTTRNDVVDINGNKCISGSISASFSSFHLASVLTPLTAGVTSQTSSSFTAAQTVVVTNIGTTNTLYCQPGATATLSSQPIAPNGGWFAFGTTTETTIACITSTSTTTANFAVGLGGPAGTGGGGGGSGGGGAITAASGAYASGSIASGAIVDLGLIADAAATAGSTGTVSAKLRLITTQLAAINTTLGTPFQAGGSIGNTGFVANAGTNLNTSALATSANQTNKTQLTQLTDGTTPAAAYTSYGTAPTGNVPGGNVFVTNTNANGQAIAANSSPVVLPAAQVTADPCTLGTKTNLPISQNGTASVQLVALSGSTSIYVCSMFLMTNSTATTFAVTTGTGTACAGSNAAVIGSTTANIANSMNLITGAGFTLGNGAGTVGKGAASSELCMILGTNVFVSGNLTYVQL